MFFCAFFGLLVSAFAVWLWFVPQAGAFAVWLCCWSLLLFFSIAPLIYRRVLRYVEESEVSLALPPLPYLKANLCHAELNCCSPQPPIPLYKAQKGTSTALSDLPPLYINKPRIQRRFTQKPKQPCTKHEAPSFVANESVNFPLDFSNAVRASCMTHSPTSPISHPTNTPNPKNQKHP